MITEPVFEAQAVTKSYGATQALKGVDFKLARGEIRGLIGANGAGKSTLFKIVAGVETPTSGDLCLSGEPIRFRSVRDAIAQGVILIHQELSLFPDLSIAENIFMGREMRDPLGLVDHASQHREANRILDRLGVSIDAKTLVSSLPVGVQQITEIARALSQDVQILLMDEPTSSLGQSEVENLFAIVRALAAEGVAIVYVSHRLDELLEICDTLTVLRDGEIVAEGNCSEVDPAWIVERMTGRTLAAESIPAPDKLGQTVLEVKGLNIPYSEHGAELEDVNISLRAGEILGVFGLLGSGRTELLESIMGLRNDTTGIVALEEANINRISTAGRVERGIVMLSEDRQRAGLIGTVSVLHNMALSILDRLAPLGIMQTSAERVAAQDMVRELGVKAPSLDASIQALSGGNQQKVLLARNLLCKPKVLLLDEPTRGVDAAAKADILTQIHKSAAQGLAVILTSSEPSEVIAASTRIAVMSRGRIVLETMPADSSEASLLEAASVKSLSEVAA